MTDSTNDHTHTSDQAPEPPHRDFSQQPVHPLRRLWRYGRAFHRTVAAATAFSILNKLFDLAPPMLIGVAVDVVVQREDSVIAQLGFPALDTQLLILAVTTALIWMLESVFEYLYRVRWRNLAQAIQHQLRMDTYGHVQLLGMSYFEEQSTGRMLSVLNDDINQLERFLDEGANAILQLVTTTIVIGTIFLVTAPSIGWMTILPMPFIAWGSVYFQNHLAPLYGRVREQVGVLNSRLANNLSGIATIKSFTAESRELAGVRFDSEEYQTRNRQAIRISSAFVPLIRMIIVTGFIAILYFGGRKTLDGELAVWQYSVLIFMTQRLLWPLTSLGSTLDLYQRAVASVERVFELLQTPREIQSVPGALSLGHADSKAPGAIQFEHVTFRYAQGDPSQVPVLQDLSFSITPGQTFAIVGATGSGKSTIAKLLLRFYDVEQGVIRIDGHDLRELHVASVRGAIGLVSQDVFLFHGRVRENIEYGRPGASQKEIEAAARAAEAHGFIQRLPQGYDTIVGERGQKLSGGQRQRLSIARAVLKDPRILILDEATSAVDNETEAAIQRSMEQIARGRTTLVIAHRLSTVRNADQILVLDQGRGVELGTHEELLRKDGIYRRLWNVQTGARESSNSDDVGESRI